jgi:LacI family transcriptional regulator
MANIEAVAKQAGVSVASVSRVINGTAARADTEERVRKAIAELGYQPNSAARALKVRQSEQICLSFDDLANPAYIAMTRGVGRALSSTKYRLILSSAFSSVEEIVKHLQTMGRGFADGLIISPIYSDERITKLISELQMPVVVIGTMPEGIEVDNVYVDSRAGVSMAVQHLVETGRSKIGLINGPLNTKPGVRRKAAFENAMKVAGLKFDKSSVVQANTFSPEAGFFAFSEISDFSKFDAFVCANDQLAAGAMKFASENGISIPSDIAIIGIDNTDMASLLHPTLTSVDLRAEERGEIAADLMLDRLANPDRAPKQIAVEPKLVIRESTGIASRKTASKK